MAKTAKTASQTTNANAQKWSAADYAENGFNQSDESNVRQALQRAIHMAHVAYGTKPNATNAIDGDDDWNALFAKFHGVWATVIFIPEDDQPNEIKWGFGELDGMVAFVGYDDDGNRAAPWLITFDGMAYKIDHAAQIIQYAPSAFKG